MKEVLEGLKIYMSWLGEMGIKSVYLLSEQKEMLQNSVQNRSYCER
jgi:hypothetical protein